MTEFCHLPVNALYEATLQIPEFEPTYPLSRYQETLKGVTFLSIGAYNEGQLMGFKAGYELEPGIFYSWVGGVLPAFRRQGIAKALADHQEEWLRENGYHTLRMKTRNKFTNMLLFAIGNGFKLTGVEQRGEVDDWRIWLEKPLF